MRAPCWTLDWPINAHASDKTTHYVGCRLQLVDIRNDCNTIILWARAAPARPPQTPQNHPAHIPARGLKRRGGGKGGKGAQTPLITELNWLGEE